MYKPSAYWRPFITLVIAVPNLFGISIWTNKLISVMLFFIQSAAAITLLDRHLHATQRNPDFLPVFALAIVLGLHPISVESTLWISARADLLMTIFILLGLLWLTQTYRRQISTKQSLRHEVACKSCSHFGENHPCHRMNLGT